MDSIIFDVSLISFLVVMIGLMILPERRSSVTLTSTAAAPA